jgi:hypothetical protein
MKTDKIFEGLNLIAINDSVVTGDYNKGDKFICDGEFDDENWKIKLWYKKGPSFIPYKKYVKIVLDKVFLERYNAEKIAVNCETEKEADEFLTWLCSHIEDDDTQSNWPGYEENTCFVLRNCGEWSYCSRIYYETDGYTIIKFKDLVKEKNKMEETYEVVKSFSIADLAKKHPCYGEFAELLEDYAHRERLMSELFESWDDMETYPAFTDNKSWLINNGFIRKVRTFKPFTLELKVDDKRKLEFLRSLFDNEKPKGQTFFIHYSDTLKKQTL